MHGGALAPPCFGAVQQAALRILAPDRLAWASANRKRENKIAKMVIRSYAPVRSISEKRKTYRDRLHEL